MLIGCDRITLSKVSNLSDFKGCQVVDVTPRYRRDYSDFTAYCNGKFKKGLIPIRTYDVQGIQELIDSIEENK